MIKYAKYLLIIGVFSCLGLLASAATKSNYNTQICTDLVKRANASYNKGKYNDAKVLYEQALSTGDGYYAEFCRTKLKATNALLAGNQKKTNITPVFEISQDTVKISYLGGDYPIHVNGTNWSASTPDDENWCRIEVERKKGIVKIYSSPNTSTETRNTFVTIKNGNGKKKTVEVINGGAPEILRSSAQNLVFTPDGETNIVDIDANTDWKISDVPGWLKATKGTGDIQFTAAPNEDNKDRIAQVKVATPTQQEITINIIQGATLDSLAFSKNNLFFGSDGGEEYIHVLTNADDWRFGDFPHWCQLERIDDRTIKVHCTPNEPVDMPREASINVTTGTQHLGINVYQEPRPIIHVIPTDGIGGRKISFGLNAGYVHPFISANSSSPYTFSPVNYALADNNEQVGYTSLGGFTIGSFVDIRLYKNLYLNTGLNFVYYKYKNNLSGNMELTMQSASNFYMKGTALYSFNENYTDTRLDVPILVSYRIPVNNKSHFRINLGPILEMGLSSKLELSGKTNSSDMRKYRIENGKYTNTLFDQGIYSMHNNYDGTFDLFSKKADLRLMTSHGLNDYTSTTKEFDAVPYERLCLGIRLGAGYEYMGISLDISYQFMMTNCANRKFWDGDRWTIFNRAADLMTGYSQRNNLLIITAGYTFRY